MQADYLRVRDGRAGFVVVVGFSLGGWVEAGFLLRCRGLLAIRGDPCDGAVRTDCIE